MIEQWAGANGHVIVGWATDLDVSRSVDPFAAPGLKPWFAADKLGDWDIIACWKLDRLATGSIYLNKVMDWCQQNDKALVSVTENFDLGTWVGRLIANVIAGVAEGELEAIKERTKASRAKLLSIGRWPGGTVPYGLEKYKASPGYKLRPHKDKSKIVNRIVDEAILGLSIKSIVENLNTDGVPSPRGIQWNSEGVWHILENRALLAQETDEHGNVIRDSVGEPVLFGTPLLTQRRWDRLQEALKLRRMDGAQRTRATSKVLGVAKCMTCGANFRVQRHASKSRRYEYYKCGNIDDGTDHKTDGRIQARMLEEKLEEEFLAAVGHVEVMTQVFIPASETSADLLAAQTALDELTPLLATLGSKSARDRVTGQIRALDEKISELEQQPQEEARYESRPTGKTYADIWKSEDESGRRWLLLKSGITLHARLRGRTQRLNEGGLFEAKLAVPEDLLARMK